MQQYIKNYLEYFGYCEDDIIISEISGGIAQDLHHIVPRSAGGGDNPENIIALTREEHNRAHFISEPYLTREELQEIHNKFMKNYESKH